MLRLTTQMMQIQSNYNSSENFNINPLTNSDLQVTINLPDIQSTKIVQLNRVRSQNYWPQSEFMKLHEIYATCTTFDGISFKEIKIRQARVFSQNSPLKQVMSIIMDFYQEIFREELIEKFRQVARVHTKQQLLKFSEVPEYDTQFSSPQLFRALASLQGIDFRFHCWLQWIPFKLEKEQSWDMQHTPRFALYWPNSKWFTHDMDSNPISQLHSRPVILIDKALGIVIVLDPKNAHIPIISDILELDVNRIVNTMERMHYLYFSALLMQNAHAEP